MSEQLPPEDDLDGIFELSQAIDNQNLRTTFEVLVARLRRDLTNSLAKPPSTLQLLVVERTAFHYILIKDKELHAVGTAGGFAHMTAAKEYNAFWMNLAEQLNKMMQAGNMEYRDNLQRALLNAVGATLREVIPDPELQRQAVSRFNTAMAEAGM